MREPADTSRLPWPYDRGGVDSVRTLNASCQHHLLFDNVPDPAAVVESMEGGFFDRYVDKVHLYHEVNDLLRHFRPTW